MVPVLSSSPSARRKLTLAEGVERIVKALRKARHQVAVDIPYGSIMVDGTILPLAEGWSTDRWPGVSVRIGLTRCDITQSGRIDVAAILATVEQERERQRSEDAKVAAAEEAKRAISETQLIGAEVSVGTPWIHFDNVPTMPLELRIHHVRAEQVRHLLEAINGVLRGEVDP